MLLSVCSRSLASLSFSLRLQSAPTRTPAFHSPPTSLTGKAAFVKMDLDTVWDSNFQQRTQTHALTVDVFYRKKRRLEIPEWIRRKGWSQNNKSESTGPMAFINHPPYLVYVTHKYTFCSLYKPVRMQMKNTSRTHTHCSPKSLAVIISRSWKLDRARIH